ncbi:uncharacterized protein EI97DRAFT_59152 [Westerdykella ornata]|uniref:Uncharacterized protein n=1 Tax=Westerdykella ornata TaxID=318751 RepID=A0A6A6JHJ6_WESOR|nr:uncharacterized protein EI97DRAFT_59152 [Westerdykella ornata]KAF2275882.1 hypothetical protein EI97DRAFT_59152 [Westerdykella ornata]
MHPLPIPSQKLPILTTPCTPNIRKNPRVGTLKTPTFPNQVSPNMLPMRGYTHAHGKRKKQSHVVKQSQQTPMKQHNKVDNKGEPNPSSHQKGYSSHGPVTWRRRTLDVITNISTREMAGIGGYMWRVEATFAPTPKRRAASWLLTRTLPCWTPGRAACRRAADRQWSRGLINCSMPYGPKMWSAGRHAAAGTLIFFGNEPS